jgi:hypothetical protein
MDMICLTIMYSSTATSHFQVQRFVIVAREPTMQYPSTDKQKKSFLIQNAQFHLNGAWPKIEVIYMKQAVSQREFHVVSYYATLFCVVSAVW